MAEDTTESVAERWIAEIYLADRYAKVFAKKRLPFSWGAMFEFNAVSEDKSVVAVISTDKLMATDVQQGAGRNFKVLADLAFLYGTACEKRVGIFTEACMWRWANRQQAKGRIAPNIELLLVEIPPALRSRQVV